MKAKVTAAEPAEGLSRVKVELIEDGRTTYSGHLNTSPTVQATAISLRLNLIIRQMITTPQHRNLLLLGLDTKDGARFMETTQPVYASSVPQIEAPAEV